ncbi:MAG: MotA/TolQ/ExbB proton channel family protein, partial [candidate division WOR-3 bacterium]
LGNSAPFIGLLGTVIGIIRAFKLLEVAGSAGPTAVMVGIAEALVTTAMGLFVAIPCAILFNYFMNKVKNFYTEMEVASKELLVLISEGAHRNPAGGEIK